MKARGGDRRRRSVAPSRVAAESAPELPVWKAFVVQFSRQSARRTRVFSGRIEHLHSGHRVRFTSRRVLLATLERMLDEIEDPLISTFDDPKANKKQQ